MDWLYELDVDRQEIEKSFGRRLKELRKQKGWTQKELAVRAGVRAAQLNKYECGLHSPPVEALIKLAEALDRSVDYLLTGSQEEAVPLHNLRLLERFREVEEFAGDDQEMALQLLDALILRHKGPHAHRQPPRRRCWQIAR